MPALWPLPDDSLVREVRSVADQLALAARYRALDRTPEFPRTEFRALGEAHLLGLTIPPKAGGRGLPLERAAVVLFHLAYVGGTTFAKLSLQPEFTSVLLERGSPDLVRRWFDPLIRGERLVGNQITEPAAGSDARGLALRAELRGDVYELTGEKSEAAFAADAEAALVYGKVGEGGPGEPVTAFLVPQDLAGISRTIEPTDMGERWQRRGRVVYDHVRLPVGSRVGGEGDGFAPLLRELVRERGLLAAIYLGVARASLDETIAYVGERATFGRPLSEYHSVAFPLVDAAAELEAAWLLTLEALRRLELGEEAAAPTAMAKVLASSSALRAVDLAIQFHGGRGYSGALAHEQRYRDLRSGPIAHGPSEVLRGLAARSLWAARSRKSSGPGPSSQE